METNLLYLIDSCFKESKPPHRTGLVKEEIVDFYEGEEVQKNFALYTWQDIPNQTLTHTKSAINYLTNEALMYFLPAYLKLIIKDFNEADTLVDTLLEKLTLPSVTDTINKLDNYLNDDRQISILREYYITEIKNIDHNIHEFINRASLLSVLQSQCVLKFLNYLQKNMSGHFEDQVLFHAIYRYWFIFETNNGLNFKP